MASVSGSGTARRRYSDSSDSEQEDLDGRAEYPQPQAEKPKSLEPGNQEDVDDKLKQVKDLLNNQEIGTGPTRVEISGNERGTIIIGNPIIYHSQPETGNSPFADLTAAPAISGASSTSSSSIPATSSHLFVASSTDKQLQKHTEDIRFYYKTQLVQGPLPWIGLLAPHFENFTTEMVIKEISSIGRDVKAGNELDFRQIFCDSKQLLEEGKRCCILVEGNPGYGKTTLARKIAADWGHKADYIAHFKLLVFIYCRDLRGRSLEDYVASTFPPLPVPGAKEEPVSLAAWAVDHRQKMLFVLDGLDECSQADTGVINDLLGGRKFNGSSILATSRPLDMGSTSIHLHKFSKTVAIKGFNRERIEELVKDYFKNRKGMAEKLVKVLFSSQAYQSLVTCPLLCQLFCYIFGQDEQLSEKVTDVYYRLILNLIRNDILRNEGNLQPADDIPPEYEEALVKFGRLCIQALIEGKFYFTTEEISKNLPDSMRSRHPDVIMGFLVKTRASPAFMGDGYQPLHKTFLEFVSAFYLKSLVDQPAELDAELKTLCAIEYSSVEQVLLYTVEMLADSAHHILSRLGDIIDLRSTGNLKLLNASGCCDANIRALTSVMDLANVTVKANLKEIEAWRNICVKSDVIHRLRFQWDPKCDSLRDEKVVEFFEDLEKHNISIEEIEMSMFHGEIRKIEDPLYQQEKDYFQEEVAQFGESILRCMRKKNLKRFCVNFQVIQPCDDMTLNFSKTVVSKIVQVFEVLARELVLEDLNMNIDISTSELVNLLAAVTPCFSLKKLGLLRVSSEAVGFRALAGLVTQGRLQELEVSLNVTKYWRRLASSIKRQHGIGSVEMFQDPLQNLGRQAFENTMEGSVRMDGEEVTKEAEDRLASITEEVNADPFLGPLVMEHGGVWTDSLVPTGEGRQEVQVGFLHLRLGDTLCPLPRCSGHGGRVSGFHYLFQALADKRCRLRSFQLSQSLFQRSAEYLACLGEALAANTSLTSLKLDHLLADSPSIQLAFPLLLSLHTNSSLTHLDLSSLAITVQPSVLSVLLRALAENTSLVRVDLSQWKFQVELGPETLAAVSLWCRGTGLRELVLQESEFLLQAGDREQYRVSDIPALYYQLKNIKLVVRSLETLNISSLTIWMGEMRLRARDFLPLLHLPSLKQLDVSDPPSLAGEGQEEEQLYVDDQSLATFMESLRQSCGSNLQVLRMDNWGFRLARPGETLGRLKVSLQAMASLNTLSINNFSCVSCDNEETGAVKVRSLLHGAPFLRSVIKHLPRLERLSIMRSELCPDQVPGLVRALKARVKKNAISLHTKHVGRCRVHPEHAGVDGLEQLVARLARSRLVKETYSGVTGSLTLEAARPPGILRRISSILTSAESGEGDGMA